MIGCLEAKHRAKQRSSHTSQPPSRELARELVLVLAGMADSRTSMQSLGLLLGAKKQKHDANGRKSSFALQMPMPHRKQTHIHSHHRHTHRQPLQQDEEDERVLPHLPFALPSLSSPERGLPSHNQAQHHHHFPLIIAFRPPPPSFKTGSLTYKASHAPSAPTAITSEESACTTLNNGVAVVARPQKGGLRDQAQCSDLVQPRPVRRRLRRGHLVADFVRPVHSEQGRHFRLDGLLVLDGVGEFCGV